VSGSNRNKKEIAKGAASITWREMGKKTRGINKSGENSERLKSENEKGVRSDPNIQGHKEEKSGVTL